MNFLPVQVKITRAWKPADCKVEKMIYFYLATIIQENRLHFPKPVKNFGTIPFLWHYHGAPFDLFSRNFCNWNYFIFRCSSLIYPCSSLISRFNSRNHSIRSLISFTKNASNRRSLLSEYGPSCLASQRTIEKDEMPKHTSVADGEKSPKLIVCKSPGPNIENPGDPFVKLFASLFWAVTALTSNKRWLAVPQN